MKLHFMQAAKKDFRHITFVEEGQDANKPHAKMMSFQHCLKKLTGHLLKFTEEFLSVQHPL